MDAMHAAIKQKRSKDSYGLMGAQEESPEVEQKESSGMTELCSSLSPEQKEELLALLMKDVDEGEGESARPGDIEKGKPTAEEKTKIEAKMAEEPEEETDVIMVGDAKPMQASKPRNLGERASMYAKDRMQKRGAKA